MAEKKVNVEVVQGTIDLKVRNEDYDKVIEGLTRMGYEVEALRGRYDMSNPKADYSIIHVVVDEDHGDPSQFLDVYMQELDD